MLNSEFVKFKCSIGSYTYILGNQIKYVYILNYVNET